MNPPTHPTPMMTAAIDLIGRTGATTIRIGYDDNYDDSPDAPTVWFAVAAYTNGTKEAAGALDPEQAVYRLCEAVIDGGLCTHCGNLTIFDTEIEPGPLNAMGCVYSYDPELNTFRRGCEGTER